MVERVREKWSERESGWRVRECVGEGERNIKEGREG